MFVRYWMTSSVITIAPQAPLIQAMDAMRTHKVNRLPVVEDEKLAGIVSISDLRHFIAPGQELKAALPRDLEKTVTGTAVSEVMSRKVVTCSPDTLLEDAGELLRRHRIGGMPVVHQEKLAGILTESDYLRAMAALAHLGEGRRVCFRTAAAGKAESFYELVDLCKAHGVELLTLSTQPIENGTQHLVLMRVRGARVDELVQALWAGHHNVLLAE